MLTCSRLSAIHGETLGINHHDNAPLVSGVETTSVWLPLLFPLSPHILPLSASLPTCCSALTAHCNPLESLQDYWCLGLTPRDAVWYWVLPGHQAFLKLPGGCSVQPRLTTNHCSGVFPCLLGVASLFPKEEQMIEKWVVLVFPCQPMASNNQKFTPGRGNMIRAVPFSSYWSHSCFSNLTVHQHLEFSKFQVESKNLHFWGVPQWPRWGLHFKNPWCRVSQITSNISTIPLSVHAALNYNERNWSGISCFYFSVLFVFRKKNLKTWLQWIWNYRK